MRVDIDFDISRLEGAVYAASGGAQSMLKGNVMDIVGRYMAKAAAKDFKEYIHNSARSNPEMLWHMYKQNQIGQPSGRLFYTQVNKLTFNTLAGGKERKWAMLVNFMDNREKMTNRTGRMRDGVKFPTSAKLGTTSRLRLEARTKLAPDTRDESRNYSWRLQATDVEFGRTIKQKAKNSPKRWMAIPARPGKVVFARKRTIDYSQWGDNGYGGFSAATASFYEHFEQRAAREVVKPIDNVLTKIQKKVTAYAKTRAARETVEALSRSSINVSKGERVYTGFRIIRQTPAGAKREVLDNQRIWEDEFSDSLRLQ